MLGGELVQWLGRWTPGPGVLPAGVRPPDSERKIFKLKTTPPTRRRSEVGGAEPEIWRSPNQKRRITLQTPKGER